MTVTRILLGLTLALVGDHPHLPELAAALPPAPPASVPQLDVHVTRLTGAPPTAFDQRVGSHLLLAGSFGILSADQRSGRALALLTDSAGVDVLREQLLPLFSWLVATHDRHEVSGWLLMRDGRAALLHGLDDDTAAALSQAAAARGLPAGRHVAFRDSRQHLWAFGSAAALQLQLDLLAQRVTGAGSAISAQAADGLPRTITIGDPAAAIALLYEMLSAES